MSTGTFEFDTVQQAAAFAAHKRGLGYGTTVGRNHTGKFYVRVWK